MSNKEILERAIQKAMRRGWEYYGLTDKKERHYIGQSIIVELPRGGKDSFAISTIIFNHDFAAFLWGTDWIFFGNIHDEFPSAFDRGIWFTQETLRDRNIISYDWGIKLRIYQYHLQQMVIADDPIKYLGEHLDVQKQD